MPGRAKSSPNSCGFSIHWPNSAPITVAKTQLACAVIFRPSIHHPFPLPSRSRRVTATPKVSSVSCEPRMAFFHMGKCRK
ncbi:hypothetical protein D3C76_1707570 [compost metagenome]